MCIFPFTFRQACAELFQGPGIFAMKIVSITLNLFLSLSLTVTAGRSERPGPDRRRLLYNIALHAIGHRSLFSIIIPSHPGMILAEFQNVYIKRIWIPAQNVAGMTSPYYLSIFRPMTASRTPANYLTQPPALP
jgi:hypothetical protein